MAMNKKPKVTPITEGRIFPLSRKQTREVKKETAVNNFLKNGRFASREELEVLFTDISSADGVSFTDE